MSWYTWMPFKLSIVAIYPSPFTMELVELKLILRYLNANDVMYKEGQLTCSRQIHPA